MPLKWATLESNGDAIVDMCEVQMCSLGFSSIQGVMMPMAS